MKDNTAKYRNGLCEVKYAKHNIFLFRRVKTTIRQVFGGTYLPGVNALEYPGENSLE